jgi:hypothetical protein
MRNIKKTLCLVSPLKKTRSTTIVFLLSLFFHNSSYSQQSQSSKTNSSITNFKADPFSQFIPDSLQYLIPILDSVRNVDQKYRSETIANTSSKKQTKKSIELFQKRSDEIRKSDSLNVLLVTKIIDRYGWLGTNEIGYFGMQTIFFVLQHADFATQEKYLPIIRGAFHNKKLSPFYLALFEDRLSIKKNKYQIYGTQLFFSKQLGRHFFFPIHHPENTAEKRKNIGIDTLVYNDYLRSFNLNWQLEKYLSDSALLVRKNIWHVSQ